MVLDNMFPDHIETYYLKVEGLKRNKSKHFRTDLMRLSKQVAFRKNLREVSLTDKGTTSEAYLHQA
jgi:hypothetical protein